MMSSMWGVSFTCFNFTHIVKFNLIPWFTHVFTFIYFIQIVHVIILFWKNLMCHSLVLTNRHLYPCYEFHPHRQHWYGPNFIHTIFFVVSSSISCIWFNFIDIEFIQFINVIPSINALKQLSQPAVVEPNFPYFFPIPNSNGERVHKTMVSFKSKGYGYGHTPLPWN